jgi:hypothetical protein
MREVVRVICDKISADLADHTRQVTVIDPSWLPPLAAFRKTLAELKEKPPGPPTPEAAPKTKQPPEEGKFMIIRHK